jgi:hypothetical protein
MQFFAVVNRWQASGFDWFLSSTEILTLSGKNGGRLKRYALQIWGQGGASGSKKATVSHIR